MPAKDPLLDLVEEKSKRNGLSAKRTKRTKSDVNINVSMTSKLALGEEINLFFNSTSNRLLK